MLRLLGKIEMAIYTYFVAPGEAGQARTQINGRIILRVQRFTEVKWFGTQEISPDR